MLVVEHGVGERLPGLRAAKIAGKRQEKHLLRRELAQLTRFPSVTRRVKLVRPKCFPQASVVGYVFSLGVDAVELVTDKL